MKKKKRRCVRWPGGLSSYLSPPKTLSLSRTELFIISLLERARACVCVYNPFLIPITGFFSLSLTLFEEREREFIFTRIFLFTAQSRPVCISIGTAVAAALFAREQQNRSLIFAPAL